MTVICSHNNDEPENPIIPLAPVQLYHLLLYISAVVLFKRRCVAEKKFSVGENIDYGHFIVWETLLLTIVYS